MMSYVLHSRHLTFGIIFFLIALATPFCGVDLAQANSPVVAPAEQQAVCHPTVMQGWRPYRVGAADTVETLAQRADLSAAELMAINCLETESLKAGQLLLLPATLAPVAAAPAPTAEPVAETSTVSTTVAPSVTTTITENAAPITLSTTMETAVITATAETPVVTATVATPVVTETVEAPVITETVAMSESAPLTTSAPLTAEVTIAITPTTMLSETAAVTVAAPVTALVTVISTTATVTDVVATPTPDPLPAANGDSNNPPSASPGGNQGLVTLVLLLAAVAGFFAFILRPQQSDSPAMHRLFSVLGNFIFLFGGLLVGLIYFPTIQPLSLAELPTGLSAGIAASLIVLLAFKEVFLAGGRWRTMSRLLNFGIVPLLVLFFVTVATRVADVMR